MLCVATYVPGGILALLTRGPSALAGYLTSWGLVQKIEQAHPIEFWGIAGALLLFALVGFVIDRVGGHSQRWAQKHPARTAETAREVAGVAVPEHLQEAEHLRCLGDRARLRGSDEEAAGYFQQALAIHRQVHNRQGEGDVLTLLGRLALRHGQLEAASTYLHQALAVVRDVQDLRGEGELLTVLGQLALRRGQRDAAEAYFIQALAVDRETHNRLEEGIDLTALGQLARARGQPAVAERYFQQALVADREAQNRREVVMDLTALGELARARGESEVAEAYFQQALAIGRELHNRQGDGEGEDGGKEVDLGLLGHVAAARGESDQAEAFYRQSLALALEEQHGLGIANSKAGLGEFLIRQRGQPEEGCRLLAEAAQLYDELGISEQADRTQVTAQLLGCAEAGGPPAVTDAAS
jgi:tetratricopeptide (TPR) repeat protein